MNNKNTCIALLGTSADPPTNGHQELLKGLLNLFPKVITWASDNPLKRHSLSLDKRYQLLKALVKEINDPNLELTQGLSYPRTITTLNKAIKKWPKSKLVFIIGSDLIEQIPTWQNVKEILKKTRIGIAPRTGWPINKNQIKELERLGGKIEILPLNLPEISSSYFREEIIHSHIPDSILPILIKQNLYGVSEN